MTLRKRYQFFLAHAGYCTPPGRAACALSLAKAEVAGEAEGFEARWEDDPDGWQFDDNEDMPQPSEVLACIVTAPSGYNVSLWGIGDPDSNYRRVVEAELTAELLHQEQVRKVDAWERSG